MDKNHKGYQEALRRIDFVKQSMGTVNEIFELDLSYLNLTGAAGYLPAKIPWVYYMGAPDHHTAAS